MSAPLRTYRPRYARVLIQRRGDPSPAVLDCARSEDLIAFLDDRAVAATVPWDEGVAGCGHARPRETVQLPD